MRLFKSNNQKLKNNLLIKIDNKVLSSNKQRIISKIIPISNLINNYNYHSLRLNYPESHSYPTQINSYSDYNFDTYQSLC